MVVIPYKFRDKDELRKWLWKYLSDYHLTMIPRLCFARIPSFKATEVATARLVKEARWKDADTVLISPDDATYHARWEAIREGKRLFVPIPKTDEAYLLDGTAPADAQVAAMMKEVGRFGKKVPLADAKNTPLIVTCALSVDRYGGWLGQGEIFGEMARALMQTDGPFADSFRIALVDDMQIFENFGYLLTPDDAGIDRIVTKTQSFTPAERPPEPEQGPLAVI